MKKEVTTRKRRIRCAAQVRKEMVVKEYLEIKGIYENEAKKAQIESWKRFCEKQDKEGLWEGIYRVIGRTAKRHEDIPLGGNDGATSGKRSAGLLADTFYPEDQENGENTEHRRVRQMASRVNEWQHGEKHDPPFTRKELDLAMVSFNPKKAPGSDGFTADICEQVLLSDPSLLLAVYNRCLQLSHFPICWKEATVIALRKPGKEDYTNPKSYRPIGLLPVMGKILEKMIVGRLKWHLIPKMSTRQYGFMPQKSTEDALYDLMRHIREKLDEKKLVIMVSLDIEGAFDSAWWPAIKARLAEEKCPVNLRRIMTSYLENRTVRVVYAGEEYRKGTNKGCVQGSIAGPILWNLLLDPLLKGLDQRGDYCQAFADDVVLMFAGDTALEVQRQANAALEYVRQWGVKNKLKFAPHKTNAMILTRKLKYDTPLLNMGGIEIGMSKEIKILGLTIDNKLTFNAHTVNVCKKALNVYKQLSKAAKVNWGLHSDVIRIIYVATVEPIILYAASAWSSATTKLGVQKQLNVVQRGFAQKLCKAYRTVSLHSALVLAGILPLDLRIQEAAALYEAKRGVPQPSLGGREMERRMAFAQHPHPAEYMNLQFMNLVDQEAVHKNNDQAVQIYTDGSKIDGKVGAAVSFVKNGTETRAFKLKLPSYCTVYQAELLAICKATRAIIESQEFSFGIFSDSRSALDTIVNSSSTHPLAAETRENIRRCTLQNKVISLFWIKAHAGLEGNERADQLAKEAAMGLKTAADYDSCPGSYVRRLIRSDTVGKWNRRYLEGETASTTKVFLPNITVAFSIIKKIQIDPVLTQILTGHGGFSEYLNRFKCKESPACICDTAQTESILHLLTECPVYNKVRFETEMQVECKITTDNICKIMENSRIRQIFIDYCKNIVTKVNIRNK